MVSVFKAVTMRPRKLSKAGIKAVEAAARQQLVAEVEDLEQRSHSLGMHVTAHALNRAKNALVWEIAGNVEMAGKASRDERQA